MTKKEKKEKRSSLAQKVSDFFEKRQELIVPIGFVIVIILVGIVFLISRAIAYVMGNPNLEGKIALIILVAVAIAEVVYEHRLEKKGQELEDQVKGSNTSDETE